MTMNQVGQMIVKDVFFWSPEKTHGPKQTEKPNITQDADCQKTIMNVITDIWW